MRYFFQTLRREDWQFNNDFLHGLLILNIFGGASIVRINVRWCVAEAGVVLAITDDRREDIVAAVGGTFGKNRARGFVVVVHGT